MGRTNLSGSQAHAQGHCFDEELRCLNSPCRKTFADQQQNPRRCNCRRPNQLGGGAMNDPEPLEEAVACP